MISSWKTDFRLQISLRLLLIFLTMIALGWLALRQPLLIFSLIGLSLVLLVQIVFLFQALQKIYLQLEDFFTNLRFQDTTRQTLPVFYQGKKLAQLWQEIQSDIQQLRERNESLLRYYSVLLEKVPVPLLRLGDEKIELINGAARHLFQRNQLHNLQDLASFGADFATALVQLKPGAQQLLSMQLAQQTLSLAASATAIHTADGESKIVSLQVIQRELDRQQVEAWQQLVQVLAHEIMNSMTPIRSLSNTARELLQDYQQQPTEDLLTDINEAMATVSRRSEHLMDFVQAYRTVAQSLTLDLRAHPVAELLEAVAALFARELQSENIRLSIDTTPAHLMLTADAGKIEQVLINLIKNALEALREYSLPANSGFIQVRAYIHPQGQLVIDVIDNGPGIAPDKRDQIFVPFYTSKRNGTGIGLFVAQQVMQAHGGSVSVIAQTQGSCLRLQF